MTDLSLVPHVTSTQQPEAAPLKRCAIIGTAQSWKACPYQDQSLEIWSLNDAYLIGVPRATRWYDLHPFHQMNFRVPNKPTPASEAYIGMYLRPHGHLDWLKSRPFPVFLAEGRPDFPTARAFPRQAVLEHFAAYWPLRLSRTGTIAPGPDYEVSTPSWMLMQAIMEGYREIHVYGIHLATQWEYIEQRPNFEFLLGIAAGKRIKLVLPEAAPICKAAYRYAFEPKADLPIQRAALAISVIKEQGAKLHAERAALPVYALRRRREITARLQHLDAELADAKQTHQRATLKAQG